MIAAVLRLKLPWCCRVGRAAVVIGVLATAGVAFAHDVDGKLGIGFEESLTAVGVRQVIPVTDAQANKQTFAQPDIRASGLAGRAWFGNVGVEGIFGFLAHIPRGKDAPPNEFASFLSLGATYNVVRGPQVNLGIGVRALAAIARTNVGTVATDLRFGIAFEIPVRIEYFFNQTFAIAGAFGPTLAVNTARPNPLTGSSQSFDIAIARGDFGGGLGFTYYLR
ncbi:MAG: hypothetical protein EXR77_03905 [Myxococcales bacterium]|nr:hypothetical protein [Myxococcales bacterium]